MRSYEAARNLFSFLAFLAWCVVVIGGLIAMVAAESVSSHYGGGAVIMTMLPGFGLSIVGLILVAFVQMGRASVDTAEYSQQILKTARDQLEVSRQVLKAGKEPETGFASVATNKPEKPSASFADRVASDTEAKPAQQAIAPPTSPPSDRLALGLEDGALEYQGKPIEVQSGKFLYNGIPFETLISAQNYIDNFGDDLKKKEPLVLNKP